MPWLITIPAGDTYTCDAFDAPKNGSLHMLNATHMPSRTTAEHWVIHAGQAPRQFTAERVDP